FTVAWFSQCWLRTRYPRWFNKYNYILGAGLEGGTQIMYSYPRLRCSVRREIRTFSRNGGV
ncbi:hypothetical protein BD410DRAFT_727462, partial [Rickenella mellea]